MEFIRKLFIKNYKNVSDQKVREDYGRLAGIIGILSNLVLFIIKIIAGILSRSISIIADSINNLSDMGSSIITVIGFKISSKPADEKHPYGHERFEYISGLLVSIIILIVGFQLGYSSILKIISNDVVKFSYITIIILSVSIILKLWQSYFYYRFSKYINSIALKATSQDSRNDVISTTVLLVGVIVSLSVKNLPFSLDGLLGLLVSIFVLVSGLKTLKETIDPLIGVSPDSEYVKKIIDEIKSYDKIIGVHDVICHFYGPTKCFMTVHCEVSKDEDLFAIHDVIDNIEHEIGKKNNINLTIHMDPIDDKSEIVNSLKENVTNILREYDEEISIHDFRIVNGESHTNIIFDILIPYRLKNERENIYKYLQNNIKKQGKKYYFIVHFDYKFL